MFKANILFVCLACIILGTNGGKAPFITPCKWDDEKCLISTAQPAVPILAAGISELDIPVVDPLILKEESLEEAGLKIIFKDLTIVGIAKCKVHSLRRDISKSSMSVVLDCPLEATGQYTVEGKLLQLAIEGKGPFNINTKKLRITATIKTKEVDGNGGKKYWNISNVEYTFEPQEKWAISLEHLFSGDKAKADAMIKLINDHSKDLINTIGKPIIDAVINKCVHSIKKLFAVIPIDELQLI